MIVSLAVPVTCTNRFPLESTLNAMFVVFNSVSRTVSVPFGDDATIAAAPLAPRRTQSSRPNATARGLPETVAEPVQFTRMNCTVFAGTGHVMISNGPFALVV
ncbi:MULTISPECIES: hypothetical protein [Sorangium]|uniref:hypothetical protein n=1 Tax=Sorangium TaxID=39643 RepID=UPI0013EC801F|nr:MULTISPECIES: hypothetical protein [Sorangium]